MKTTVAFSLNYLFDIVQISITMIKIQHTGKKFCVTNLCSVIGLFIKSIAMCFLKSVFKNLMISTVMISDRLSHSSLIRQSVHSLFSHVSDVNTAIVVKKKN